MKCHQKRLLNDGQDTLVDRNREATISYAAFLHHLLASSPLHLDRLYGLTFRSLGRAHPMLWLPAILTIALSPLQCRTMKFELNPDPADDAFIPVPAKYRVVRFTSRPLPMMDLFKVNLWLYDIVRKNRSDTASGRISKQAPANAMHSYLTCQSFHLGECNSLENLNFSLRKGRPQYVIHRQQRRPDHTLFPNTTPRPHRAPEVPHLHQRQRQIIRQRAHRLPRVPCRLLPSIQRNPAQTRRTARPIGCIKETPCWHHHRQDAGGLALVALILGILLSRHRHRRNDAEGVPVTSAFWSNGRRNLVSPFTAMTPHILVAKLLPPVSFGRFETVVSGSGESWTQYVSDTNSKGASVIQPSHADYEHQSQHISEERASFQAGTVGHDSDLRQQLAHLRAQIMQLEMRQIALGIWRYTRPWL